MTDEERARIQEEEWVADKRRKEQLVRMTEQDAKRRHLYFLSKDPFPNIQPALLNSADIYSYVATTGMIFPFYPENLSGASYDVAIGEKVIWWDEEKQTKHEEDLSRPGTYFKLEPNSIAFVMLEPTFRIPDYMALRFNLKIVHIYKGLLLGTGPIVDPGFVGKLSIPLHNLTANTYTFRRGDLLIAMEFTKLSPNEKWNGKKSNSTLIDKFYSKTLDKLYKRKWIPEERTVDDYIDRSLEGNIMVRSSIPDNLRRIQDIAERTQRDFADTKKDVEQSIRNIQLVAILSIIPVLVFACTAIYQLGSANTVKKETIHEMEMQYKELERQYDELKEENRLFKEAFKKANVNLSELKEELEQSGGGK